MQPEKLFGFLGPKAKQAAQLVELVQCDLEKEDDIEEALGNAGVVICTIGASEKEVLDVTGPYRIDFKATKNLIDAGIIRSLNFLPIVTACFTRLSTSLSSFPHVRRTNTLQFLLDLVISDLLQAVIPCNLTSSSTHTSLLCSKQC